MNNHRLKNCTSSRESDSSNFFLSTIKWVHHLEFQLLISFNYSLLENSLISFTLQDFEFLEQRKTNDMLRKNNGHRFFFSMKSESVSCLLYSVQYHSMLFQWKTTYAISDFNFHLVRSEYKTFSSLFFPSILQDITSDIDLTERKVIVES